MSLERNRYRIIGGSWRGRVLRFPDGEGLRPTTDRVRETLFNWLQLNIVGARCLDLFAGSGALGLEALSRGAREVTAVENNPTAARALRDNLRLLGASSLDLVTGDATRWLEQANPSPYDIVFLDPPYAASLLPRCCQALEQRGWLTAQASIYLESGEALEKLPLPPNWQWHRSKRAGQVHYGLCQRSA